MRFLFRSLFFAAVFLVGGEALRRWLEQQEAAAPVSPTYSPPPAPQAPPAPPPPPAPEPLAGGRAPEASAMTRDELYARAQELGIKGRSKMSKAQLADAVRAAGQFT